MNEGSWYAMNWWRTKEEARLRAKVEELTARENKKMPFTAAEYRRYEQEIATLQAKVEELTKDRDDWKSCCDDIQDAHRQQIKSAGKRLQEERAKVEELSSPWISVDERLPPEGVEVLVYPNSQAAPATSYIYNGAWSLHPHVTHWMPLPLPPQESE